MASTAWEGTYRSKTPVQHADEDLQGGAAHRQRVLDDEQPLGGSDVGGGAEQERQRREGEADDREVLEVPTVRGVSADGSAVRFQKVGRGRRTRG